VDLGLLQYAAAFAATFAAAVVATPLMRRVALRRDVVDAPDGERKVQAQAIPYLGGVAIAGSASLVLIVASTLRGNPGNDTRLLLGVLGPALVLSAVGLIDDIRGLTPLPRFLAQSVAAGVTAYLMASAGTMGSITGLFWLDVGITMFWVIGVTNALNLLDNTDGAASGTAGIAGLGFAAIAAANGQFLIAALALALAGSCAGFLVWNRSPARIYMGDSGSLFIGFMLAAIGVRINLVTLPQLNAFAIPILVLALPILDTTLVVTSRIQRGISPFVGGLDHLAHRLRRTGLSVRGAVRRIWSGAVVAALMAFALSRATAGAGAALVGIAAVAFVATFIYAYRLPETGDLPRS
jgi:UDP-GlcNAc:undecaprenyl-phosphate GlcNAc-1-phosphate transferase